MARVVQFMAGLTVNDTGTTWTPGGLTFVTTKGDPGYVGSTLDVDNNSTMTATRANSGAIMAGSPAPTGSAYVAIPVTTSDGVNWSEAPDVGDVGWLVTGHTHFVVHDAPAGALWVQGVVTLGDVPPTITDDAGFNFTQLAQVALGTGGYLTVWSAPLFSTGTDIDVTLSETCDAGVGFALIPA